MIASFCRLITLTVIIIFSWVNSELQTQTTFQYSTGGESNERANDLIRLPDGGYAISGFSSSFGSGNEDLYLLKLNNSFDLEWSRSIGGQNNESGLSLISSKNGGFYISGRSNSHTNGNFNDMLLMKTDENGETEWSVVNGGSHHEVGLGMVELPDDNIIIAGTSRSYSITGNGAYIFKSGPSGDPQWGTIFDNNSSMTPPATDDFRDIILCRSHNFVYMTGRAKRPGFCAIDNNSSNWYLFILKADLSGQIIWHKHIGGNSCRDQGRSLVQTNDGNIVATGFSQNYGAGGDDVYMVKVDAETGDPIWTRTYGGPGNERANEVIESADGGLVLTGVTDFYGPENTDVFLLKTDQDGNIEWTRTYGGLMEEEGNAVVQTDELGYLIAGYTTSYGNGGEDVLLIKTDIEGRLHHCDYKSHNFVQGTGGITHTGIRISEGYSVEQISIENKFSNDSLNSLLCCPIAEFEVLPSCLGDTIEIINLAQGEISSWSWDFGDGKESNENNPIHLYTAPGTYQITLIVSDSAGCSDTTTVPIKVFGDIMAQIQGDSILCKEKTTELTAKPDGALYQWSTGSKDQKISVSIEENSTFYVAVTDSLNCDIDTAFFNVDVSILPPPILSGPTEICSGENVEILATPGGYQYNWSTGSVGSAINFTSDKDTVIYVVGTDSIGCESDTARISISVHPEGFIAMSNAKDTSLGSLEEDCERAFIIFEAELDFCGNIQDMEDFAMWEIDLHNNGIVDFTSLENRTDGSERSNLRLEEYLPFGTHQLIWTFESPGGEVITEKHLITVVDNKPPTPVCLHGITSTVMPATGMISLPAKIWDLSSWDNCTPNGNLTFSFSSNPTHNFHTWTCEDLNGNQEEYIPIEIWVTDESGNQDYCRTYFLLKDNQNSCPSQGSITHNVSGIVLSPFGEPIDEVLITAETETANKVNFFNQKDGSFHQSLSAENNYKITGVRSKPGIDNFSTLDILTIQMDILKINPINNPYALIAADVNEDGKINILDINLLRSHLLGNLSPNMEFKKWKIFPKQQFGSSSQEVPVYTNHFIIHNLTEDYEDISLKAVQTGKVSQLLKNGSSGRTLDKQQTISLNLSDHSFKTGHNLKIPLQMEDLTSELTQGIQATFSFNPDILNFEAFAATSIPISDQHFGFSRLDEGLITLSWSDPIGSHIPSEQPFLELEFAAKNHGILSDHFELRKTPLAGKIYTAESQYNLELLIKNSQQGRESLRAGNNFPNPFDNQTQIPIRLSKEANLILEIYDLRGRLLSKRVASYGKGNHSLKITGSTFPAAGIYFYTIQTDETKLGGKLMVTDR